MADGTDGRAVGGKAGARRAPGRSGETDRVLRSRFRRARRVMSSSSAQCWGPASSSSRGYGLDHDHDVGAGATGPSKGVRAACGKGSAASSSSTHRWCPASSSSRGSPSSSRGSSSSSRGFGPDHVHDVGVGSPHIQKPEPPPLGADPHNTGVPPPGVGPGMVMCRAGFCAGPIRMNWAALRSRAPGGRFLIYSAGDGLRILGFPVSYCDIGEIS